MEVSALLEETPQDQVSGSKVCGSATFPTSRHWEQTPFACTTGKPTTNENLSLRLSLTTNKKQKRNPSTYLSVQTHPEKYSPGAKELKLGKDHRQFMNYCQE
jgi:hypothetical protein